jgi:hypothetical protein
LLSIILGTSTLTAVGNESVGADTPPKLTYEKKRCSPQIRHSRVTRHLQTPIYASSLRADAHARETQTTNTTNTLMAGIVSVDDVTICSLLQTSLVRLDCMRDGMKNALVVLSAQRHPLRPAHFHH